MVKEEVLSVIKRNGKKVDFDGSKIALAIKKGFDSIKKEDEPSKYTEKDVNLVYHAVINKIENNIKIKLKLKKFKI